MYMQFRMYCRISRCKKKYETIIFIKPACVGLKIIQILHMNYVYIEIFTLTFFISL